MRAGFLRASLALLPLVAATPVAQASGPVGAAETLCRSYPGRNVLFRFGTSSPPTAPPAVGRNGAIYVVTSEGYVHALHPDGSYHWSYTVAGRVTGGPVVVASGGIFLPTSRTVYAFRPEGTLLWSFASPVTLSSGLGSDERTRTYFASQDGRVFTLSTRGALLSHIPGKVRVSVDPVVLRGGSIAVGRSNGTVLVSGKGKNARFELGQPVTALLDCPGATVCAIAGAELHALGGSGARFRTPATRAGENDDHLAVLTSDERLRVFRGTGGEPLLERALPAAASGSPAVAKNGTVFVPLRNGALISVTPAGDVNGCVAVGDSPLGTPVLDAPRNRVLVTAHQGLVASISIE